MPHRKILAVVLLAVACAAHAQTKKELVTRILTLQQPGIEALARGLAEQPAAILMQQAGAALRGVPADKREATGVAIQGDLKKYVDEAVPMVRERALKLAPSTVGALLEEKFTDDELKQIIAILESPAFAKYNRLQSDLQNALTAKLVAETRGEIEPKVKALEQTISKRLGLPPPASAPAAAPRASGARAPAKAASN